jgi:uncharacterized protein
VTETTGEAHAVKPAPGAAPEPVTAIAPRQVGRPLLTQQWCDLAFLHWPVDAGVAGRLLPHGTRPDVFEGTSYVGLIAWNSS